MKTGDRVITPLGEGILSDQADYEKNGKDWIRKMVKLNKKPKRYKTNELWFFKSEIKKYEN